MNRVMIADFEPKRAIWLRVIDLILPPRCAISGEIVPVQGTLSPEAWQSLCFIAAPFCACCGYPFEFETEKSALCGPCLSESPPFATARAALAYDDASRNLILRFKHGDHLQLVPTLVPMMIRAGAEVISAVDLVIPVPLHRWRLLSRRYNQAALLAIGIGKATGKTVLADGLLRTRATLSQGHKGARDRAANVRNAFALNPRRDVTGKTVLLVDDVYTTGATVKECTEVLLTAGAKAVHILAIARVVKSTDFS